MQKTLSPDSPDRKKFSFKIFHDLMPNRVGKILLVSSPYDAFIMEEEGRLAERIIHEYRGLNLSRPPRITWISSIDGALDLLSRETFELVITMPIRDSGNPFSSSKKIQEKFPEIPVILLVHDTGISFLDSGDLTPDSRCRLFVWSGNADLLLAIIKSTEDQMNVFHDTNCAMVRVIILVEDSPDYRSSVLPHLYREIVLQTQEVMDDALNEEHRILRMRARPKILLAEDFEEAESIYRQYKPYLLGVISDVRFPRGGRLDDRAGFVFCGMIKKDMPGLPLLIMSSDDSNKKQAMETPAVFLNKNAPLLHKEIRSFLERHLSFGAFVFRLPNGKEVARASSLRQMEKVIPSVPEESIYFHAERDHFSNWLMARSEIQLASELQPVLTTDFSDTKEIKNYLVECIRKKRKARQRGVITDFSSHGFDPDVDFTKIGKGSLGGKGRGIAFFSSRLGPTSPIEKKFTEIRISIPKTLVITTEIFELFLDANQLNPGEESDYSIALKFLEAEFPDNIVNDLATYLSCVKQPLAVRSSSLLEDAHFQPFAGIYKTYMIPNNNPDMSIRLNQLIRAIKLIYASTFFEAPRVYSKHTPHRIEEEKMAVVIQQVTGNDYNGFYFPSISGVAQSYNFYPVSYMKPEEGIVHMAFGLGKTVVEGGAVLRFSPKYPQLLHQSSNVEDILNNSQKWFYGLSMQDLPNGFGLSFGEDRRYTFDTTLTKIEISDVLDTIANHLSLRNQFSSFIPEDNRIRDSYLPNAVHIPTFAGILKYNQYPLAEILTDLLEIGQKGMGAPVEIEFAVNFPNENDPNEKRKNPEFVVLQVRPMAIHRQSLDMKISEEDIKHAVCFSTNALGNGIIPDINNILYVKPDTFDPARTPDIAVEIGKINRQLVEKDEKYLLVGPGRWGSADRWLGIPVKWRDISGVGAVIEASNEKLQADPSQGTHFFHNITSLGIGYLTIGKNGKDILDESWLEGLPVQAEETFIRHMKPAKPLTIKIDGKQSRAVILNS